MASRKQKDTANCLSWYAEWVRTKNNRGYNSARVNKVQNHAVTKCNCYRQKMALNKNPCNFNSTNKRSLGTTRRRRSDDNAEHNKGCNKKVLNKRPGSLDLTNKRRLTTTRRRQSDYNTE